MFVICTCPASAVLASARAVLRRPLVVVAGNQFLTYACAHAGMACIDSFAVAVAAALFGAFRGTCRRDPCIVDAAQIVFADASGRALNTVAAFAVLAEILAWRALPLVFDTDERAVVLAYFPAFLTRPAFVLFASVRAGRRIPDAILAGKQFILIALDIAVLTRTDALAFHTSVFAWRRFPVAVLTDYCVVIFAFLVAIRARCITVPAFAAFASVRTLCQMPDAILADHLIVFVAFFVALSTGITRAFALLTLARTTDPGNFPFAVDTLSDAITRT